MFFFTNKNAEIEKEENVIPQSAKLQSLNRNCKDRNRYTRSRALVQSIFVEKKVKEVSKF